MRSAHALCARALLLCASLAVVAGGLFGCGDGSSTNGGGATNDRYGISYADPLTTSFVPGEVVVLLVSGSPAQGGFTGSVDGAQVHPSLQADGRLAFVLPAVTSGPHTLLIQNAAGDAELSIRVLDYEPIAAPAQFVAERALELEAALDDVAADPDAAALVRDRRAEFDAALAAFATMAAEDQELAAYAMRQVITRVETAGATAFLNASTCPHLVPLAVNTARFGIAAVAAGLSALAGPFGFLPAVAGGVLTLKYGKKALGNISDIFSDYSCLHVEEITLGGFFVTAAAVPLAFDHGVPRTLTMMTTASLAPDVRDALSQVRDALVEVGEQVPSTWPSKVSLDETRTTLDVPPTLELSPAEGAYGVIVPEYEVSSGVLTVTFRFSAPLQHTTFPFDFWMWVPAQDGGDPDFTTRVTGATLSPVCPPDLAACAGFWGSPYVDDGCYDLLTDSRNCGACGNYCSESYAQCIAGACVVVMP